MNVSAYIFVHHTCGPHSCCLSSVHALDMTQLKFRRDGAEVEVLGMNEASETIVLKLGQADKPGALEKMLEH